jgi:L-threonylcarbamoyladenylate synthase
MGIGCDATNPEAVAKIFKLKKSRNPKYDCFDEWERMMYNVLKIFLRWHEIMDLSENLPLLFWTTLETWLLI